MVTMGYIQTFSCSSGKFPLLETIAGEEEGTSGCTDVQSATTLSPLFFLPSRDQGGKSVGCSNVDSNAKVRGSEVRSRPRGCAAPCIQLLMPRIQAEVARHSPLPASHTRAPHLRSRQGAVLFPEISS